MEAVTVSDEGEIDPGTWARREGEKHLRFREDVQEILRLCMS